MNGSGDLIEFTTPGGVVVMNYGKLHVYDSKGKVLPASMSIMASDLQIQVDTTGAVYPITIDPLAFSHAWTAESNQENAYFGYSVDTAGDVNGDGYSDIIVGAFGYDNGQIDEGRVFVYHGSSAGLSADSSWTGESNQENARFGLSVASAGDVNGDGYSDVIVGAYSYDNGQSDEGSAFVYHGSSTGLKAVPSWTAESNQAYAYFGYSVASAGDVNGDGYSDVIVGAYRYDSDQSDAGRTFVYHGSSTGLSASSSWTAESNQAGTYFGCSVASAGDVNGDGYSDVIVGAQYYSNGESNEGGAFVYHGSSTGLSATASWTAESNQVEAYFGISVASAGDVNGDGYSDVIVGAYYYDNGEINEGGAFVYHGSSTGVSATSSWTAESNQVDAYFGVSVASAGDVNGDGYSDIILGASGYNNGQSTEGRAFVYHGSSTGVSKTASWTAESNQVGAWFGCSVASAGDVNGDGYSDVIVGAYEYDEGRAFVYHGSSTGVSATASWTAESNQAEAWFGYSVASAGDVNGDGYSDVIVGAHNYDNGLTYEGRAFVYHGSSTGLNAYPSWTAESNQAQTGFGYSVASAGDVNGDGYSDVIVGAPWYDNSESNEGRVFVYHGSSTGLNASPSWTAESNQIDAYFGRSVASAGDVNGDGYSDVILGAYYYDNGQSNEGRAFVYHGSSTGLNSVVSWTAESDQADALFGDSVASAGDVNGDGYSDVIVGADYFDNGLTNEGGAFVYHGSPTGLNSVVSWTAESNQGGAYFGGSVASAGDVNGDGYSDVIVGAQVYDNGELDEGHAFVYHGSSTGLSATASWTAESDQTRAFFGGSVASAGDVNGDGYSDVIVGAPYFSNGQTEEGGAFVYYGNGGDGFNLTPRQLQADGSATIPLLGISDSPDSFRIAISGYTPYGRGKVKLQWEVKPFGTVLSGSGYQESTTWYDTGTAGSEISELITGLNADTAYHWQVRLRYSQATTPLQQYSRWFSPVGNGLQEADLRTAEDTDEDGISDLAEATMCTSPDDADTDDDGIIDGDEDINRNGIVDTGETDPCDADTDDDGIIDGDEDINHNGIVDTGETDPCDADTDNDAIQDGTESGVTTGHADTGGSFIPDADGGATLTDPLDDDSDNDGLLDNVEDANHNGAVDAGETNPADSDTDNDNMPDGWEVFNDLNPLINDASGDADGDGFKNILEYRGDTDPNDPLSKPSISMPWLPLLLED